MLKWGIGGAIVGVLIELNVGGGNISGIIESALIGFVLGVILKKCIFRY